MARLAHHPLALLVTAALLVGCQTTPPTYAELTTRLDEGQTVDVAELRASYVESADYPARMERLKDLELQAYALAEDEPLKLGSLGTAILDTNYGSLTGHYVLARFYRYVENTEAAELHESWVQRIRASMEADQHSKAGGAKPGAESHPIAALTSVEAQVYATILDLTPVGSIYQTNEQLPFGLMLQARPVTGAIRTLNFDLASFYRGMRLTLGVAPNDTEFAPLNLVGYLAKEGDSPAQAAVGAFLASQGQMQQAVNWLEAATRTGNLVANSLLARLYWERARATEDPEERQTYLDRALENYLHAVADGSTDAMYALGILYLNGNFGADNVAAGIALFEQAAEQDHSDAIMFLGHMNYAGEGVPRNLDAARRYYARAAALGNEVAQRNYARFLLDRSAGQAGDPQVNKWLKGLAASSDPEAMLLLGNLTARGLGTTIDNKAAIRWFEKAVESAPNQAGIVNEIAWTLSVSETAALRRPEYAREIMDRLMTSNADARARPEYLDTWAASYAASGDFERAKELQREAISAAESTSMDEVEPVLREHLEMFEAGQTITEAVP